MARRRKSGRCVVAFSGPGGATQALAKRLDVKVAVNHDPDAIATHAANHPDTDHMCVDLLEHDVARLPYAEVAQMSPSCTFHSRAQGHKIMNDPSAIVSKLMSGEMLPEHHSGYDQSDRSRVTMWCVPRYLAAHQPDVMMVENVPEVVAYGPNRDGSLFRLWVRDIENLGYNVHQTCVSAAPFGVTQDRNRWYAALTRKGVPAPDLTHTAQAWCPTCDEFVEAVQTFNTPTKAWRGQTRWGMWGIQYRYLCPRCTGRTDMAVRPVSSVIDWSNLGHPISERPKVDATHDRIMRGVERFGGRLPRALRTLPGTDRVPMNAAGMIVVAAGNTHERPGSTCRTRSLNDVCWTQHCTPAFAVVLDPNVGGMWIKQNGGPGDTAPHTMAEPMGTMTTRDSTGLVFQRGSGAVTDINDLLYRRLTADEVRQIMGFADGYLFVDRYGKPLTDTRKVAMLGDGVVPAVQEWFTDRVLASIGA